MKADKQTAKRITIWLWQEWVRPILVVVIVLGAFRSAVANWYDVPSGSMRPTIVEGDRIFVNQMAYDIRVPFTNWSVAHMGDPERGDVVICNSPADGKRLVKRVVGLPGDELAMVNNHLLINGTPIQYSPADDGDGEVAAQAAEDVRRFLATEELDNIEHTIMITPSKPARRSFKPVEIPEGMYFVMGDNRDESFDSRWFGFVPREEITGRSSAVVISLDHSNYYCPRWDRFFTGLD